MYAATRRTAGLPVSGLAALGAETGEGELEGELITLGSQPADHPDSLVGKIGVVTEGFAGMYI